MGRTPCCDKKGLKKGPWTPEEDEILVNYIKKNGHGSWRTLPKLADLLRCGKSCRLRWTNYLRPEIKQGHFTLEKERLVIQLHGILGNRRAAIAAQLSGRTDNEIKNLWNTHLKKSLVFMGRDPQTHEPLASFGQTKQAPASPTTRHIAQWESARLEAEARLSRGSSLFGPLLSSGKPDSDYFLCLWNSEVGQSFRKFGQRDESISQSSNSFTSSSMKCESTLLLASNGKEETECKSFKSCGQEETLRANSDSLSSNELEDSSDTALQLLLDFPISNDDMSFLEENINNYTESPALFSTDTNSMIYLL